MDVCSHTLIFEMITPIFLISSADSFPPFDVKYFGASWSSNSSSSSILLCVDLGSVLNALTASHLKMATNLLEHKTNQGILHVSRYICVYRGSRISFKWVFLTQNHLWPFVTSWCCSWSVRDHSCLKRALARFFSWLNTHPTYTVVYPHDCLVPGCVKTSKISSLHRQ